MKSKDQIGSDEQLSTEERKLHIFKHIFPALSNNVVIHVLRVILILRKIYVFYLFSVTFCIPVILSNTRINVV